MDKTQALVKRGSLECAEFKVAIRLTFPGCDKLYGVCLASLSDLNKKVFQILNSVSFMTDPMLSQTKPAAPLYLVCRVISLFNLPRLSPNIPKTEIFRSLEH